MFSKDNKKKKMEVLIGDNGMIEKPDKMSKIVTAICLFLIVVLIFHGVMAYVVA